MALYEAPKEFVARLRAYDPLLRVRWSDVEARWRIERKITRGRWIDPGNFHDSQREDFVSASEGYIPVLFCEKNQLDERVFITLWANDVWRRGGANRVSDEMESAEAMKRKASRARWLDDVWMAAKSYKDYMNTVGVVPERARHTAPRGGKSIVAGSEL